MLFEAITASQAFVAIMTCTLLSLTLVKRYGQELDRGSAPYLGNPPSHGLFFDEVKRYRTEQLQGWLTR